MVEPKGRHVNTRSRAILVVDEEAMGSMVARFQEERKGPGFAGVLVDQEHFSHDLSKETRAFGWLVDLQAREDGLYGQVRWTQTGRAAVDGGDYRYFSTEYNGDDLEPVRAERAELPAYRVVRPMRLAGLTLTNRPNNRAGFKPITNREEVTGDWRGVTGGKPLTPALSPSDGAREGKGGAHHEGREGREGTRSGPISNFRSEISEGREGGRISNFRSEISEGEEGGKISGTPCGASAKGATNNERKVMNRVAAALGLAAEASEDAILDAVTKLTNRATAAEKAETEDKNKIVSLEAELVKNREAQADADLAPIAEKLTEEERKSIRAQLVANREATLPLLRLVLNRGQEKPAQTNRATAKTPTELGTADDNAAVVNRAVAEYRDSHPGCTVDRAWQAVRAAKPELFKS